MKANNFKKLYQDTKNRRQKQKYNSIKNESLNDDSLQNISVSQVKNNVKIIPKCTNNISMNCHNRSQSCPFIYPKIFQSKSQQTRISSSMKLNLSEKKKKRSIKHSKDSKSNVKYTQTKKKLNHKNSNSQVSQSANTVIVHNVSNQHLSYILYKKSPQKQDLKLKKNESNLSTLHKRSITMKNQLFLKTKLQQRIKKYQIKQQILKIQQDSQGVLVKQTLLQKIIRNYQRDETENQDISSTRQFI